MAPSRARLSYAVVDGELPPPADRSPELADVRRYGDAVAVQACR